MAVRFSPKDLGLNAEFFTVFGQCMSWISRRFRTARKPKFQDCFVTV